MEAKIEELKDQIIQVCKRTYDRGYVASNDGNISAKIDEERVLVTPTGFSKGFVTRDMLVIVDLDGNSLEEEKKASSEILMHLRVYKERPDVMSVNHSHPPYATGYAVAGRSLDKYVLPEVIIALGKIPLVKYGTPGTPELSEPLIPFLPYYDAFLLENHGALAVGNSVLNAYHKMETLEHFAKINFIAEQIGKVNELSEEQIEKLVAQRKKYGIRENIDKPEIETK